jgi:hypothetical protein
MSRIRDDNKLFTFVFYLGTLLNTIEVTRVLYFQYFRLSSVVQHGTSGIPPRLSRTDLNDPGIKGCKVRKQGQSALLDNAG